MENTVTEINELMAITGKAAPVMTKTLKTIGDGDMQNGLQRCAAYYLNKGKSVGMVQGIKIGTKSGMIKGSLGTLAVLSTIKVGSIIKEQYRLKQIRKTLKKSPVDAGDLSKQDTSSDNYNNADLNKSDDNSTEQILKVKVIRDDV